MISANDPAIMAAGMLTPTLTAPPVEVADTGVWDAEAVGVVSGVLDGETEAMLERLGVGVTEWTRSRVLVIVVVDVVVSAAAICAAARQRTDETMALIFMVASGCFQT